MKAASTSASVTTEPLRPFATTELVDRGGALVHHTSPVLVATPTWTYYPPVAALPAAAIAVIPAPVVDIPLNRDFGEPVFVKVIKTTTHNAGDVALEDLVSDDLDGDGKAESQNREPDEVETEFKLLQANLGANLAKEELPGAEDDMGLTHRQTISLPR